MIGVSQPLLVLRLHSEPTANYARVSDVNGTMQPPVQALSQASNTFFAALPNRSSPFEDLTTTSFVATFSFSTSVPLSLDVRAPFLPSWASSVHTFALTSGGQRGLGRLNRDTRDSTARAGPATGDASSEPGALGGRGFGPCVTSTGNGDITASNTITPGTTLMLCTSRTRTETHHLVPALSKRIAQPPLR